MLLKARSHGPISLANKQHLHFGDILALKISGDSHGAEIYHYLFETLSKLHVSSLKELLWIPTRICSP
jgi:hypothetical protein